MTFLKGTKADCEAYNQTVTNGRNLPAGTITCWSHVIQIHGDFYVSKHPDFPASEGLTEVHELPQPDDDA